MFRFWCFKGNDCGIGDLGFRVPTFLHLHWGLLGIDRAYFSNLAIHPRHGAANLQGVGCASQISSLNSIIPKATSAGTLMVALMETLLAILSGGPRPDRC